MLARSGHEPRTSMPVGRPASASNNTGRLDTRHNKHWPGRSNTKQRCRLCLWGAWSERWYWDVSSVKWCFVLIETVLKITIQRPTCKTSVHLSSIQRDEAFDSNESKRTRIFTSSFRNLSPPLRSKEITAFLRHSEQCLFPSPQNAFCFTNLSRSVHEILRFCEYHAQNLNTLKKNSASWDLQLGFNSAFKGLMAVQLFKGLTVRHIYIYICRSAAKG